MGVTVLLPFRGHARAWGLGAGFSELTTCDGVPGSNYPQFCAEPPCGQLNPASNLTCKLLSAVRPRLNVACGSAVGYPTTPQIAHRFPSRLTCPDALGEPCGRHQEMSTDAALLSEHQLGDVT